MKKVFVFLCCLVLGPILGCLSSIFWHEGANTFWKKIDYFPYPVKNIIATRPHGREIWVETLEDEFYQINYPCLEDQSCWIKQDIIPNDLSEEPYIIYNVSKGKCENNDFTYPLLHKIEKCITSIDHAPDATWTTSVALTGNKQLWVWDQPWEDPFSIFIKMQIATILGGVMGLLSGILLAVFMPSKKGTHK